MIASQKRGTSLVIRARVTGTVPQFVFSWALAVFFAASALAQWRSQGPSGNSFIWAALVAVFVGMPFLYRRMQLFADDAVFGVVKPTRKVTVKRMQLVQAIETRGGMRLQDAGGKTLLYLSRSVWSREQLAQFTQFLDIRVQRSSP